MPSAPAWDPQDLARGHAGVPPQQVTDAELARLQTLSRLRLSREGGEDSPYERVRRDVAAVLGAAGALQRAVQAEGLRPAGGVGAAGLSTLAAHLETLPEEELEALALERWARLRPDCVTEAAGDAVTRHAAGSQDGYFVVPRFIEE